MLLKNVCLATSLLLVQSTLSFAQEGEAPRNSNSRLRRSGSQSFPPEEKAEKPKSGSGASASASSSSMGFGFGNGRGFGQGMTSGGGMNPPMGFGNSYGNPMQTNRSMGFGNGVGMGGGRANSQASVSTSGDEKKTEKSASPSARRESANVKSSATSKKNKTSSFVDDDRSITVVESKNKVKVTISYDATDDEKTYSAKNPEELKKKFPDAYEAYQLATEQDDEGELEGDAEAKSKSMLEEQFKKMEAESAGNPAALQMIEEMRRDLKNR
jgi:hypothetical protein